MTDFASCNVETVDVHEVWSGWAANAAPEMSASVHFALESPTGVGLGPQINISLSLTDIEEQSLDRIEALFLDASLEVLRRIVAESPQTLRDCMARSRVLRPAS